jgi:hypothetical protein
LSLKGIIRKAGAQRREGRLHFGRLSNVSRSEEKKKGRAGFNLNHPITGS